MPAPSCRATRPALFLCRLLEPLEELIVDPRRAIVVLHYYLGMSLSEVADTLDIPAGTVKSRLHRALSEMRIAIGEPADEPRREAVAGGQVV